MEEWPEQKTLLLLRFFDKNTNVLLKYLAHHSNKQFKVETMIFILDFNGFSTTNSAFYCYDALHEILMLLSSVYKAGFNSVRIETAQL